ncbi:hypothetical protein MSG28_013432 [Choristoneura fumiferana]|uniref:Uncharacterized protein n=1 Tax=Choristoneura fumiferana TaxID=7141 RepID=A0ACC0KTQ1_CHOFU|nr:hypothetical protein MSG28_013432 [Choristoneura fumiferana]
MLISSCMDCTNRVLLNRAYLTKDAVFEKRLEEAKQEVIQQLQEQIQVLLSDPDAELSSWPLELVALRDKIHDTRPQEKEVHVVEPCARSARIATTILLANPAVKQQCLHCSVSAWRMFMGGGDFLPSGDPLALMSS